MSMYIVTHDQEAGRSRNGGFECCQNFLFIFKNPGKEWAILNMSLGFGAVAGYPDLPMNEHISTEVLRFPVDRCLP